MTKQKQLNIRLDEKIIKDVKILCAKKDTSVQDAIKLLIEKWLDENKGE